ncbi:MAG: hypothetical protein M1821_008143 [Bathelium mastoideum]|nr:MAG: hypothetical protein M1821_008143 [Bathelium mastoideum]
MPIFHDIQEDPPSEADMSMEPTVHGTEHSDLMQSRSGNDSSRPPSRLETQYPFTAMQNPTVAYGSYLAGSGITRGELIQRLKRAQSPVQSHTRPASRDRSRPASRSSHTRKSPSPLLPAVELRNASKELPNEGGENRASQWHAGMEIERPRSALHSGDFRQEASESTQRSEDPHEPLVPSQQPIATSPPAPWHSSFPIAAHRDLRSERNQQAPDLEDLRLRPNRSRAISQSLSKTGFFYQPPSSPLVQQSNNTDLGLTPRSSPSRGSRSPDANRRHTFSPYSFQTLQARAGPSSPSAPSLAKALKRENSAPYQAHQPRRSLSGFPSVSVSTPQTPYVQPRRTSVADVSPLHASMVGSYEESILRGRMSTTPSRPLNFIAQIGVLGRGKCKLQLKCPPHASVPFPAVFYSYGQVHGRRSSISEDSPSPYVGLVDLEHSLQSNESRKDSRRRQRQATPSDLDEPHQTRSDVEQENLLKSEQRKLEKMKRRSTSPKAPPGGSYRIPQQGQLQIVLKNPNKTAVKLFLVPYDLSDMPPGTKTFIRQRSYSAGPIIDMPISTRKNLGTDRPEAALSASDDPNERPVLRYLIHLHICCPSRGRYFLYKSIRVVFANRVPDGKERLRNEIQLPEPRYSAYKPSRDSTATTTGPPSAATERMLKRRSLGGPAVVSSAADYDRIDGVPSPYPLATRSFGSYPYNHDQPVNPIPFPFTRLQTLPSRPGSRESTRPESRQAMDVDCQSNANSNGTGEDSQTHEYGMASPGSTDGADLARMTSYDKLVRGEAGYPASPPEGLLARRLRGLDVQRNGMNGEDEMEWRDLR